MLLCLIVSAVSIKGFSLIEFIVAATLTLGVLMGSGVALSSVERNMSASRSTDVASAVGISALEQAALFNCARTTDLSDAAQAQAVSACKEVYSNNGTPLPAAYAGDYIYLKSINNVDYIIEISSTWMYSKTAQTTPVAGESNATSSSVCPSTLSASRQPSILERVVTVSWETARNGFVSKKYVALESYYRQDPRAEQGGLIVKVPTGGYLVLKRKGQTSQVVRQSSCSLEGLSQVYFPYLPQGDYEYIVGSLSPVTDIVSAKKRLSDFKNIPVPSLTVTISSNSTKVCTSAGACS
jgi:hypothetical protein